MTTGNYSTPDLPNPYDYQSISLDPNVTQEDLDNLSSWLDTNKALLIPNVTFLTPVDPLLAVDGSRWLLGPVPCLKNIEAGWNESTIIPNVENYTIIDEGTRVGVVGFKKDYNIIQWASWVPDHNYSVRGIMKMLDTLLIESKLIADLDNIRPVVVSGWNINDFDLDVINKLQMVIQSDNIYYGFKNNCFWWNDLTHHIWGIYNKMRNV